MDRAALRAAAMGEKKEGGGGGAAAAADGGAGAAASRALQQCGQLQKLIDISIGSLRGLRTKCSVSNDLTQQEIRTLELRAEQKGRLARISDLHKTKASQKSLCMDTEGNVWNI
ncbi:kinase suppressor of Ras 1-like [Microtus pennsylvanicus]|uniref:kinase suppressor of Ras 1-like n=1 Tax=Microtus pennsylvanicus TaxID=10058 RepID=UPI003F6C6173